MRDTHRRERRVFRRLDDDRAAGGERRGTGSRHVVRGKVPRRDETHNAQRLLEHELPLD
jgi:hypothetical protein